MLRCMPARRVRLGHVMLGLLIIGCYFAAALQVADATPCSSSSSVFFCSVCGAWSLCRLLAGVVMRLYAKVVVGGHVS